MKLYWKGHGQITHGIYAMRWIYLPQARISQYAIYRYSENIGNAIRGYTHGWILVGDIMSIPD